MATIHTKIEPARGCGYRHNGFYMVSEGSGMECGKLPIELLVCHACHQGVHPTRGFTWINTDLFKKAKCRTGENCGICPMAEPKKRMGLIWIGSKFYKTPRDFTNEAAMIGISRRVAQMPNNFEVNKTWVALAHRQAISTFGKDNAVIQKPGIFHAFKPTRIEYVVKGDETEERLDALEKRGFTLVKVIRDVDAQQTLQL